MYQALNQEEWEQEDFKPYHSLLMESLTQRLDSWAMVGDLVKLCIEDMLQYNAYKDESQNAETFPMLDKEPVVTPRGELPLVLHPTWAYA